MLSKRPGLKIWIINESYLAQSLLTLRFENQEFLIPRDHLILSNHLTQILLQFPLVCKLNQISMCQSSLLKFNRSSPHPGSYRIILRLWICRPIEVVAVRLKWRRFIPQSTKLFQQNQMRLMSHLNLQMKRNQYF